MYLDKFFILTVTIKTKQEIELLRKGGKILAGILKELAAKTKTGVSALELNGLAEGLILKSGGEPAFKGYGSPPYPATLCISVNDAVVHGIPTDDKFKDGEVVKLDIGMKWPAGKNGLFTDMAVTVTIGKISADKKKLLRATKKAMMLGIKQVRLGKRIGDISSAIQKILDKEGIGIVRKLAGHGVGYEVHEDPLIPNYGKKGTGIELKEGMVLAIEVMTTLGSGDVKISSDGWTFESADGATGAHFEHTVVVTKNGAEILTLS